VSGPDAGEREAETTVGGAESNVPRLSATSQTSDATTVPGDPEEWMRRDDEFLLDADREYVLWEEGRTWRGWVAPVLFGAGLAVLVGDAITIGVAAAIGLEATHPVATTIVAELGLGGLVLLKAMAAVFLLLVPGVTDSTRQTARAGLAGVVAVGLLAVVANAWALFVAVG
jgi:hypothetical protein